MDEFKELVQATLALMGHLVGWILCGFLFLACIILVVSIPILMVAGIYKVICFICHMPFSWGVPIIAGIGIFIVFGMVGLDDDILD